MRTLGHFKDEIVDSALRWQEARCLGLGGGVVESEKLRRAVLAFDRARDAARESVPGFWPAECVNCGYLFMAHAGPGVCPDCGVCGERVVPATWCASCSELIRDDPHGFAVCSECEEKAAPKPCDYCGRTSGSHYHCRDYERE